MRRAVAHIEDNAPRDITLANIVSLAGLTPLSLQYAFRRHLDTTPMTHLRRVLLSHAHHDLKAARPGDTTVTWIAMRWGFGSRARFTTLYRKAYEISASTTPRT
ncbi:helix-turn-helix transcriptional regulator [Streptomyces shenzhenensis]|uniref:helix-turn-helix transcriptional regulator n=1 Tax=Streptomyces shenzhenensis TaxID=943815 RepID=UPI001C7EF723|nr:helix-turn-helix transcriptional regulator [Streptomyces shenzhenensis]